MSVARSGWLVVAVVGIGLSTSVAVWGTLDASEQAADQAHVASHGRESALLIRQRVDREQDMLGILSSSVELVPHLTQGEGFEVLARELFSHHDALRGISWNPLVQPEARAAWSEARGTEITERGPDGTLVPAGARPFHVPVDRIEPRRGNEAAIGFDVTSEARRFAALSRALSTGESSLTAPIHLVQSGGEGGPGFLVFRPVPEPGTDGGPSETMGFVVAIFEAQDLITGAAHSGEPLRVSIEDVTDAEPVAVHGTPFEPDELRRAHEEVVEVGGRQWRMRFLPTTAPGPWRPSRAALGAGFVLTGLVAWILSLFLRRAEQIHTLAEDKAREMTHRLEVEEERRAMSERMQSMQRLESLGILTGGIAHDFNNLLTPILAYAELVRDNLPPQGDARDHIEQVILATGRAADLVRQLLAYAGQAHAEPRPLSLSELVGEMAKLLESSRSPDTGLHLDLAPDLPAVLADATQLRQIALNLLTNADDALQGRPGDVFVRTGARDLDASDLAAMQATDDASAGYHVFLEVRDGGSGMSDATRQKMFEPFFTTRSTGRGLGLSATHGIVRAHRGAIDVVSEPGAGTTITVFLPACDQAPEASIRSPAGAVAGRQRAALVVDDEPSLRRVARLALERSGFEVVEAEDGVQAVEQVRQHPELAIVILDLTMPRMDGTAASRQIAELRPGLPIVLTSGFEQAQGYGPSGVRFLRKPWTVARLLAAVEEAMSDPQGAGTPPRPR